MSNWASFIEEIYGSDHRDKSAPLVAGKYIIVACSGCNSEEIDIAQMTMKSGAEVFAPFCKKCDLYGLRHISKPVIKRFLQHTGKKPIKVEFTSSKYRNEFCEVCGAFYTEVHHWAPYHIFGDESDDWPVANLCRSCHQRWHKLVTPNMCRRFSEFEVIESESNA